MPGPPKTPTALTMLRGNPGKRPLPENEPILEVAIPRTPTYLSKAAKKHFKAIAKQLAASRVMTNLDADALAVYCEAHARWVEANEELRMGGMLVLTDKGYRQSSWVSISNKAFEQMKSMLLEFGMTPASRTKVQTVPDSNSGKADPWQKI